MPGSRQISRHLRLIQTAGAVTLIAAALFLAWCAWQAALPMAPPAMPAGAPALPDDNAAANAPARWHADAFPKNTAAKTPFDGALAQRYRLAGTFFASGEHQQSRKAIIDDLRQRDQILVGEGDQLDGENVLVVSINNDFVLLRAGNQEEKLWLSFVGGPRIEPPKTDGAAAAAETGMLERFGARVEDRRWLLKRDALLDYYQEVMADTERLAKIFESLKPVYKASRISGYVLDVEGEKEMFNAFGLQQNDVIRKVNSMPMTSQNRAEYFIREFVNNRVNGFVLDIERDGKPQKFVYLVR